MKRGLSLVVVLSALGVVPSHGQQQNARTYEIAEMTWTQIDALDRERTLLILPIGMLEEHGPHLPIAADTIGVAFEAGEVARRVARALPQWRVVMMPLIDYGHAGANIIGGRLVHPGTYGLRQSTVRALLADIGAQAALNRFKWIFVLTGHGAPTHGIAVNEACDFVSQTLAVTMLHVSGLFRADEVIQATGRAVESKHFPPAASASIGLDVHAGTSETSAILALRPDLVPGSYKKLPALTARTREELVTIASTPGWQGYFSAPAQATAAYGRAVEAWWVNGLRDLILRAIGGQDLFKAPRAGDTVDPVVAPILGKALEDEQAFDTKLQEWLARHRRSSPGVASPVSGRDPAP